MTPMTPDLKETREKETKTSDKNINPKCKFCDTVVGDGVITSDWKCELNKRIRVCDYHFNIINQLLTGYTSWNIDLFIKEIKTMVKK